MSKKPSNKIITDFTPGKAPLIIEEGPDMVRLSRWGWKAPSSRINEVLERINRHAAIWMEGEPDIPRVSKDLYSPDEYVAFKHAEKCLTGMIVAYLYRQRLIPLEPLQGKSTPRRYRVVPDLIDPDLANSPTLPRS